MPTFFDLLPQRRRKALQSCANAVAVPAERQQTEMAVVARNNTVGLFAPDAGKARHES